MTSIQSKDDVLTLLTHLGYLAYDAEREEVYIPNEEVRREFIRAVKAGKHKEVAGLIQNSDRLLDAMVAHWCLNPLDLTPTWSTCCQLRDSRGDYN
jgi:hypothetical protein